MYLSNSLGLLLRLASERPNDPLATDPGVTEEVRECPDRVGGGPNEPPPDALTRLRDGREAFLDKPGRGADEGPGEPESPRTLMSSG